MHRNSFILLAALALPVLAQDVQLPHDDAEKIADALKAAPPYITQGATIVDWPTSAAGEYRVLRKGNTEWTCLPTYQGLPHHQPMCADPIFFKFFQDAAAHRPIHVEKVGISYMYQGDWVSPHGMGGPTQPYHVTPHIMIVVPDGKGLENYTTDGSTGHAYVNRVPGTETPYLVIPIHEVPR